MRGLCRAAASAAAVLLLGGTAATAATAAMRPAALADRQVASARLLDVPFIAQTEDLCGGAALAMVMRYWGERQVYADDFAALIDRSAAGIRTDVLAEAVRRRGWSSSVIDTSAGAAAAMVTQIDRGRPVVALIEVRPNRYHYVVLVAWTAEQIVVHDPALAPFRVMSHGEFERAWRAAGRWALLVLPGDARPDTDPLAPHAAESPVAPSVSACGPLLPSLVAQAVAGDLSGAERGLLAATAVCPDDAAPWRELAGIRFLQSRWAEAGALAERAARLAPGDEQGLDLLATSRFLSGAHGDALGVWNRIGRPSVDLVRVEGAEHTRHPVIAAIVGLPPRTLLTPERYQLAARRLQALPSAVVTRLRYRPTAGGLAELDAAVVERPTVPRGVVPLAALAAHTAIQRELRLEVAAPTGSGELWTAAWRWWEARPRVAFALSLPSVAGLPGITTIQGVWERASYAVASAQPGGAAVVVRQERRRASFGLADWATGRLRWTAGAALDRWDDDSHAALDAGLDLRLADDHVALGLDAAAWTPLGSGRRFATSDLSVALRSTTLPGRPQWWARAGVARASSASPYDLWPGAGTGLARAPLLRAHPLLDDGVVTGAAFGRQLTHGTLEYQHPLVSRPVGTLHAAAFVDTARTWNGPDARRSGRWQTDVGAGVRVALPGAAGTLRVDLARGLADGQMVVSAGWLTGWAGR